MIPPMGLPHNCLIHLAEGVKKEVSIPVVGVGRIIYPRDAEEILQKGKADLIAFGRALVADPELPLKTKEGREDDIRTCIGCNQGCIGTIHKQLPMTCLVNPAAGREREFKISKAKSVKKIVVVGAGPAGLEASRVAALRGHKVVVFEKEKEIGGKLRVAKIPPTRETIGKVMDYYGHTLPKLGVDLRLGREVNEKDILGERPDEVVVATGRETLPSGDQRGRSPLRRFCGGRPHGKGDRRQEGCHRRRGDGRGRDGRVLGGKGKRCDPCGDAGRRRH